MSRIKRIQHPVFLEVELDGLNPIPKKGELVGVIDDVTGFITKYKIGDGVTAWLNLPWVGDSEYPYTDVVTNPIGDVDLGSVQEGRYLSDIIKDMISPYVASVLSNVKTNAAGSFANVAQLEVGQSVPGPVTITFSVSNEENLVALPIDIDTAGVFTENDPYANQSFSITPVATLNPSQPTIYEIKLRAQHQQGYSAFASAYIRFDSRFIWGASNLADLTTTQHALDLISNGGGQQVLQGYQNDYEITANGYGYVLIPSFLNPNSLVWTDVTDPNAPASISMQNLGVLSVNNGVATYNYTKFRTPFSNTATIKLRAV